MFCLPRTTDSVNGRWEGVEGKGRGGMVVYNLFNLTVYRAQSEIRFLIENSEFECCHKAAGGNGGRTRSRSEPKWDFGFTETTFQNHIV